MKLVESHQAEQEKVFQPFDLTLRFETPEEARLMWHVMNRLGLWGVMQGPGYRNFTEYVANSFGNIQIMEEIEKYIGKVKRGVL